MPVRCLTVSINYRIDNDRIENDGAGQYHTTGWFTMTCAARYHLTTTGSLFLLDPVISDSGSYTVRATNKAGLTEAQLGLYIAFGESTLCCVALVFLQQMIMERERERERESIDATYSCDKHVLGNF